MDIQYGAAVIVILLGFGLTFVEGGTNEFFVGAGWGTISMGCIWVAIRIIKTYKKK